MPSIHGQWLEQTSTLSHQAYTYDTAGRLTQVQNTPAGKGCTTRIYAYDEDTNRTSLATREPNTKGECATEGGRSKKNTPMTPPTASSTPACNYNTFGDITTLPANDAEEAGAHELTSTYYTDNQVASQNQNEQTIGYNLDPAGRTLETVSTGEPNNSDHHLHYAGPGNAPAWTPTGLRRMDSATSPASVVAWSAIQNNGETPVLQLTNLHGDIIATAYLSETATELASKADTSEFGVPDRQRPSQILLARRERAPNRTPLRRHRHGRSAPTSPSSAASSNPTPSREAQPTPTTTPSATPSTAPTLPARTP